MKLLLDTHVLLWWLADAPQLSPVARETIADPDNVVYVSTVGVWEIVIKRGLGKLDIPDEWVECLTEEPFQRLQITWEHALEVGRLPDLHRDPFDRLLIAQSRVEDLVLATHDEIVPRYDVKTLRV
ncbi:MAG: type II toxin-antitoxin system VapC family toxin [Lentisphaerae bacterium]|jgi:PIN domain nuclease of toxin-antitoxin system|nr:type II toxin-antitoxin system VapC family toxin [Lentisphaerota bacterium]MBT4821714.1 type II toxin-antitoxin system VapC family toxin [Lentisphaerota bacterium]MBT5605751.1 type II toxin-antitoxin system VapC family toxin [Lentisphaerota bacterium]MBT7053926.1 type II toxin-antitoxin system VapC family toxin [Lentisphaerota bacterium]MBT7843932.1 type II toxin-antitoxin system VapC family toxin [Lentisphaerota bacterium]